MSFLRKWSTPHDSGSNPTSPSSTRKDSAPQVPAFVPEWPDQLPTDKYFGLENFGNTCYANSVLQALYFSKPFRDLIESYPSNQPPAPPVLVSPSPLPPSPLSTLAPLAPLAPSPVSPSRRIPTVVNLGSSRSAGGGANSGEGVRGLAGGNRAYLSASPSPAPVPAPTSPLPAPTLATLLSDPLEAPNSTLLSTLHDLFTTISSQPKSSGSVAPQAFIHQLRRDNEFFRSTVHQDAHEFLNYLINEIAEQVEKRDLEEERLEQLDLEAAEARSRSGLRIETALEASPQRQGERERSTSRRRRRMNIRKGSSWTSGGGADARVRPISEERHPTSGVHELFEGVLTNETRCLTCETITSRDEAFLDLSIDIEPNSSVTSCLRQFSASEMLCQRNKFSCDRCCGLQEAEKRMKIKKLPNILALHLKRFKYEESLQRHVKLTYRVVFPFELRLFNTSSDVADPDRLYELWAIIVHIGIGPHHGHYITIVKSGKRWVVFDDNTVVPIDESEIQKYFGDTPGQGTGYVLFYQAADLGQHATPTLGSEAEIPAPPVPHQQRSASATSITQATNGLGLQFISRPNYPATPIVSSPAATPTSATPTTDASPIILTSPFDSSSAASPELPEDQPAHNGARRLSNSAATWGAKVGIASRLSRKISLGHSQPPASSHATRSAMTGPAHEPLALDTATPAPGLVSLDLQPDPSFAIPASPSLSFPEPSENGSTSTATTAATAATPRIAMAKRPDDTPLPGIGGASLSSRTMSFLGRKSTTGATDKALKKAEDKEREKREKERDRREKEEKKKLKAEEKAAKRG